MNHDLFSQEVDAIVEELSVMLKKKNRAYGSSSFADGDIWDVLLNTARIHDKASRLKFLTKNIFKEEGDTAPFGESIDETLRDLFGYAIIGLIINKHSLRNGE